MSYNSPHLHWALPAEGSGRATGGGDVSTAPSGARDGPDTSGPFLFLELSVRMQVGDGRENVTHLLSTCCVPVLC